MVVVGQGHEVHLPVRDADKLPSLPLHLHRVSHIVGPETHRHALLPHGSLPVSVRQCAPEHRVLAVTLHQGEIMVCIGAELLLQLLRSVRVFVSTDMDILTAEHRVFPVEIFLEEIIHKGVDLGVEDVEMVHAVFLRSQRRVVLGEGQRVGRRVNLRHEVNAAPGCRCRQLPELPFGVAAVLSRQSRIGVALQAEGAGRLHPVVVEVLLETIVVEVQLQEVHLVVRHHPHQLVQIRHRDVFPTHVEHEATDAVLRHIDGSATGQCHLLFRQLQECLCGPVDGLGGLATDLAPLPHGHAVALLAQRLLLSEAHHNVARPGLLAVYDFQGAPRQQLIVPTELLGHGLQRR